MHAGVCSTLSDLPETPPWLWRECLQKGHEIAYRIKKTAFSIFFGYENHITVSSVNAFPVSKIWRKLSRKHRVVPEGCQVQVDTSVVRPQSKMEGTVVMQ